MKSKTKKSPRKRGRIWSPRPVGLDPAKDAPFWRGERAEQIVRRRVKLAEKEKQRKLKERRRKADLRRKEKARASRR